MVRRRPLIGYALGGGAGRGWAHIGALRALERAEIRPDIVCGTSIGALVGGVHLAGYRDELENWARSLNKGRILRYLDPGLSGGGLIGGRRLERLLKDYLAGTRIEDLPVPFRTVTTELNTGHEIWLKEGPLIEAMQASYALPGVLPPIQVDERWLVDGALVNPVPVSVCRAMGARLVIAINLNADQIGRVQETAETDYADLEGRSGILDWMLGKRDGPSVIEVMATSLNILQDRLSRSRLAGDPPDVTIAPRVGHIGLLEFDRAEEAIQEGEEAVARSLPFLQEALKILGY